MTEKQFEWDTIDGDIIFYEEGAVIDYDDVVDLLNDQDSKIVKFESGVKSAIVNERTDLGRSVLKQLAESLDIDF